ncbi:O-fucosyltransferase 9 [Ancistrocladus abbreviatus]
MLMHGYNRLVAGVNSQSSSASPGIRQSRMKPNGGIDGIGGVGRGGSGKLGSWIERVVYVVISAVFRRKGVLLFAPLLYILGMVLYMGSLSFDSGGGRGVSISKHRKDRGGGFDLNEPRVPGSLYRSPQVFEKLLPYLQAGGNHSSNVLMSVWQSELHQGWEPCVNRGTFLADLPKSNGYFIIEANGGLNQQRLSICDAVAVAGLLNATLVVPMFHLNSVWRDSSKFSDIFDEDFFIHALRHRVNVVRQLPEDILQRFDNNISSIVNLRLKAWSNPTYYIQKVLPKLLKLGAVRVAPFSNRLANAVPPDIQGLRCFANFEALRFSLPIYTLAEVMVQRMIQKSSQTRGKYVSVHLRFEKDMVAFSCCLYDGGMEEKQEMDIAREKGWRGKFHRRGRIIRPGAIRRDGKCPLSPLEVGMMLRGMGFANTTSVYVASGKIYKAEKYMAPLRELFPLLETKETLATPEELAQFQGHSSRLAALDYTVCLYSEVFVTTQGGNFPHFLMGHRRYMYRGHAKTIMPDKRKLALLFDNPDVRWDSFKRQMRDMLHRSDLKGTEIKKPSGSLYTFPMPDCMCKIAEARNENGKTLTN